MKKMLDLFSGLGGASEAFVDDPNWEVLRIENNPLLQDVPHTQIMRVQELLKTLRHAKEHGTLESVDVVWASPPCREFSLGYSSPRSRAARNKEEYNPDLSLLDATMEILSIIKPRFWVIENVRGAIEYFKPHIGAPRQTFANTIMLWGNFPMIHTPKGWSHSKMEGDTWSTDPLRANKRAKIPIEISRGLKEAIEAQRTLFYFND